MPKASEKVPSKLLTKEYILNAVVNSEELHIEHSDENGFLVWDDEDAKYIPVNFLENFTPARLAELIHISPDIPSEYSIDKEALARYLLAACDNNCFVTLDELVVIWSEPEDTETFEPADFTDNESKRLYEKTGDEYAFEIGLGNLGQLWFEKNIVFINMGELVRTAAEIARDNGDTFDSFFDFENQVQTGFLTTAIHELRHLQMDTNIFLSEDDYPLSLGSEPAVENYCREAFERAGINSEIFSDFFGGKVMSKLSKLLDRAFENKGNKSHYKDGPYSVAFEDRAFETLFTVYFNNVPVLEGNTLDKEVRLCTHEGVHPYDGLFKAVAEALTEYHFDGEVYRNYMKAQQENKLLNAVMSAEGAAIRDDYSQIIIRDGNGDYSFTREANGEPVTPLMEDEEVVGRVSVFWDQGRLKTAYEPISAEQSEEGYDDIEFAPSTHCNEELFCHLADELRDVIATGEYGTWEDVCAEISFKDDFRPGYNAIVVWGEENDAGEKFFSVSVRNGYSKDDCGEEIAKVFTDTCNFDDLEEAVYSAIRSAEEKKRPSLASQIKAAENKASPMLASKENNFER